MYVYALCLCTAFPTLPTFPSLCDPPDGYCLFFKKKAQKYLLCEVFMNGKNDEVSWLRWAGTLSIKALKVLLNGLGYRVLDLMHN